MLDGIIGIGCLVISIFLCTGAIIYLLILLIDIKYQLDCIENKVDKIVINIKEKEYELYYE